MSGIWNAIWSETAASNTAAVPNGWPTGMLPSTVKTSAREMMSAIKRDWNLAHPTLTTAGAATAYTLSPTVALDAYVTGQEFAFKLHADLGANATINVSTLGARKIYLIGKTGLFQPVGGEAKTGHRLFSYYDAALDGAVGGVVVYAGLPPQARVESFGLGITTETGLVVLGTGLYTMRMPYAITLSEVRAQLKTAQSSGSILTIDIKESGVTILSTKLTIDNTELTSTTAATPPVISDTALANDAQITVDVTQVGSGTAAGLKIILIGKQT